MLRLRVQPGSLSRSAEIPEPEKSFRVSALRCTSCLMPNNPLVLHITRGHRLSYKQARRAVENCAAVWVEVGVSIRDAGLLEAIGLRNEQARLREPLAAAELPGLIYEPSVGAAEGYRRERQLAVEAGAFAAAQ